MTGTDETLRPQKSRITIFDEPVICSFCTQDVFIPYWAYVNVEQPGIGVYHARYVAICQHCGQAKHFSDPSYYDEEKDTFVWALNQELLSIRTYRVKMSLHIGKRSDDKITVFINQLMQHYNGKVEKRSSPGRAVLQMKITNLNDAQTIRWNIMHLAMLGNVAVRDLSVK
ncbi:MAG: hypothetical protein ABS949_10535 [Solibacillus sp.]